MALLSPPRVVVPASVRRGDVFRVKAIIGHTMETGLRRDAEGRTIPRQIINRFECRYDGVVVFSVDLHEPVSKNPFLEFHLRATRSAVLEFIWLEDGGSVYNLSHALDVT